MTTITTVAVAVAFAFRSIALIVPNSLKTKKPAAQDILAAYEANKDSFDLAKDGTTARRKSIEVNLHVPTIESLAGCEYAQQLITDAVADFVKDKYVDKFVDIGAHDWATVKAAWKESLESKGGFAPCPYSDADFLAAQAALDSHLDKVAPKLGLQCQAVIKNRCAKAQVQKAVLPWGYSVATLDKLYFRVIEAAEQAAVDGNENTVGALAYCAERIETLKAAIAAESLTEDDM